MSKEFSFLNEKIKEQPFYKKKPVRMVAATIGLAILFGLVSCTVFVKIYPWMSERGARNSAENIQIPQDSPEDPADSSADGEGQSATVQEVIDQEITIEDYEMIYDKLRTIADEVNKSLVTVTAVSNDVDWFNKVYENHGQSTGTIIGDNGVELLILTDYQSISSCDGIRVSFCDAYTADAALKKYDLTTQLAVISVNLSDIPENTMNQITKAKLGNSWNLKAGIPVMALGMADGSTGSVQFGMLTSVNNQVSVADGEYKLLMTDMDRNSGSHGVIANLNGEVIGLIQDVCGADNMKHALSAWQISDMKSLMEHLSNNQDVVYLGILGISVTDEIARAEDIPKGIYVKEVKMDSPAMIGGIQNGDILQKINGQPVETMSELSEVLKKLADKQIIKLEGMRQTKTGYKKVEYQTELKVLE
ncbi:MAG: S1C family serine protease [Lachnospiraceae bacterium]